jgi:hypothetical protein
MRLNHGPTPVTRLVVSPGQMRGFYQCCLRALFLAIVLHLIDFPGGLLPGSQLHLFGVAEVVAEDCPGDPPPPPQGAGVATTIRMRALKAVPLQHGTATF